jgi:hypothetical protein
MEAVQTLQILQQRVEVREGGVFIDGLLVEDRTLAELIERRLEREISPEETVTDALEIGARVLDREATSAEVDFVKREFERVSAEVEHSFAERARRTAETLEQQLERFLGEDNGTMAKVLDSYSEQLSEVIAANFGADRSTAVQHQVREMVTKLLQDSRQELLRQFSAEDGHNPLADFKGSVVREMRAYRDKHESLVEKLTRIELEVKRLHDAEEAQAEVAAAHERGTQKGRDFEQRVFDLIEEMALARGDVAHHVGDTPSASGGKRGDIVVEIEGASGPAAARIAFDAKDEKLSKNRAWEALNASIEERDAGFAVLVVASDEKVPAGREQLHEYEGNKMIVALDKERPDPRSLELAYRYGRCRCLMATEKLLGVDAAGVRDAADEAMSALREAQKVRRSLTGATNGVEAARAALDSMVARVEASLARIESLVSAQPGV